MAERFILIVGGAGSIPSMVDHLIDGPHMTAPIYIGPPPLVPYKREEEPMIPLLDIKLPRKSKTKDWEQRNRKRRR